MVKNLFNALLWFVPQDFYRIWRLQMAKNSKLDYILCNEANMYIVPKKYNVQLEADESSKSCYEENIYIFSP